MRAYSIMLTDMVLSPRDYTWLFLRGAWADIIVGLCLGALCTWLQHRRYALILIWFAYMVCLAGNSMSIIANDAHLDFTMIDQTANDTFIFGVIITPEYMSEWLHVALGFFMAYLWVFRLPMRLTILPFAVLAITSCAYPLMVKQPFGMHPSWVSTHVFERNIGDILFAEDYSNRQVTIHNVRPFFQKDLIAPPRVDYPDPDNPPNVLMIIIESVGHRRLKKNWLPYLSSLNKEALVFDQYYTASQVTSNGLYALFCGDNPGLIDHKVGAVKGWKLARKKEQRFCLPQLLKDAGYTNVFMEPASLKFQNKKNFIPKVGFDESFGKQELLPIHEGENKWGKDDLEFYYYVYEKIKTLDQQTKPWFLTALTVTTHYPIVVPEGYLDGVAKKQKKRKVTEYADMALKSLMTTLKAEGYLDNTLVIITNDEVRHGKGKSMKRKLRRNHGILTIITPNNDKGTIDTVYGQTDMMLSIADYLSLPTEDIPIGRSYFRRYDRFRPFFLTHYYSRYIMVAPEANRLIFCQDKTLACQAFIATDKTLDRPFFYKKWEEIEWTETWKNLVINIARRNDKTMAAPLLPVVDE